ncbi:MAG: DNA polymerase/3'-5' exonuclease PolX [Pirellulaceae bacterium]|nr:DNA polymerase/3'-5' exonuclease PolX [Pirellulaceae bacterium]
MQNSQIAEVFDEMADLLEIAGESSFRIRAYRTGSQIIRDLPDSLSHWIEEGRDLTSIDGIGSTLAEKSTTLVKMGNLPQLIELRQKVPPSLRTLLKIPGLGAKKVAVLFKDLGITDLPGLRAACVANQVKELKGFGVKTQQSILDGISIAEQAGQRMRQDQAEKLVSQLRDHISACLAVKKLDFAGSYRRKKESIGDIDILVVSEDPDAVMQHFIAFESTQEVIAHGPTKSSIRVKNAFQVDLRAVDASSWGAALQYFTGSKEHNVVLRGQAKKLGLKLNEYGVFPIEDETRSVAGASESDVYQALGLPWIPPEFRENRLEWRDDFTQFESEVVRLSDIRGDLHMHTTETDGENSLEEMVAAARKRSLKYIAITDHSQRVSMARGLDSPRLLQQWSAIDRLNATLDKSEFVVLKGIECDILENGEMDLPDDVLLHADWVMASIHYGQKQSREQITDRILNAIKNRYVTAISHPTGRLIGRREPYEVDLEAVFQSAIEHHKFMEINANPRRLDLNDVHCMAASAKGVQFVVSTDAHSISNLELMPFGIQVARRAGLKREQVFNTRSLDELYAFLDQRRIC